MLPNSCKSKCFFATAQSRAPHPRADSEDCVQRRASPLLAKNRRDSLAKPSSSLMYRLIANVADVRHFHSENGSPSPEHPLLPSGKQPDP